MFLSDKKVREARNDLVTFAREIASAQKDLDDLNRQLEAGPPHSHATACIKQMIDAKTAELQLLQRFHDILTYYFDYRPI